MLAAQLVQLGDDLGNLHLLAVNACRNTGFEGHGHIFALFRSFFRADTQNQQMIVVRLVSRILKLQTLMADVPQVTVTAVAGICGERQVNTMGLAICDLGFTGIHGPLVITPCSDDLQIRCQSLDTQLETDLVVTFTGSTVADGCSAFFSGNLNQLLGDNRTGHGCT